MSRTAPHSDTVIYVPTFNRLRVAQESLANMRAVKQGATLLVTDDHSTEHDGSALIAMGDGGFRNLTNKGIDQVRLSHLEAFLNSNYHYCYFADSDTLHDPEALDRARHLYDQYSFLCTLYNTNSAYHKDGDVVILEGQDILFRNSIPGCSMYFDRTLGQRIYAYIEDALRVWGPQCISRRYGQWDWAFCFAVPAAAMSQRSYCDHLAIDGLHSFVNDRALAPTPALRAIRAEVVRRLNAVV